MKPKIGFSKMSAKNQSYLKNNNKSFVVACEYTWGKRMDIAPQGFHKAPKALT